MVREGDSSMLNSAMTSIVSVVFDGSRWAESLTRVFVASALLSLAVVPVLELALRLARRSTARMRFLVFAFGFVLLAVLPLAVFAPWRIAGSGLAPHPTTAAPLSGGFSIHIDILWALTIAVLWAGASLARAVVLLLQGIRLWRVAGSGQALPIEPWMRDLSPGHRSARSWRLVATDAVESPCVIGFFSPRILIPSRLAASLGAEQLRPAVLHELAHLRRGDDWTNLLQKLALVVFPLHPGLCWLDRVLTRERELACDEAVVAAIQSPRAYASCLVEIAAFGRSRSTVALPFARLRSRSELSSRVARILNPVARLRPAASFLLAASITGGALLASVVLLRLTPEISFAPDTAASPYAQPTQRTVDRALLRPVVFHPQAQRNLDPTRNALPESAFNISRSRAHSVRQTSQLQGLGLLTETSAVPVALRHDARPATPEMRAVTRQKVVAMYLVFTEVEQTGFTSADDGTIQTARITQTVFSVMTTVEHTGAATSLRLRPEWMSLQL